MITGILLAAGNSSRFGSDKLLHPLADGVPMAIAALRNLKAAVDDVVAVIRPGRRDLAARLQAEGARVIENSEADRGMGTSLACGVRAAADADGWVVALADMPYIRPATIRRVADALSAGAPLAAPVWAGTRGHPVGFAKRLGRELSALSGVEGARALLLRQSEDIELFECNDPGVLVDVDTPADLGRVGRQLPTESAQIAKRRAEHACRPARSGEISCTTN
jgi:molybdenum cofactor cytidylyltransferase